MTGGSSVPGALLIAADYKALTPPFGAGPRYELIEGELIEMFSAGGSETDGPDRFHQTISRNLVYLIEGFLRQHALGDVYAAPINVYLDDKNVFQPDIVFVSNACAERLLKPEGVVGAPDLVIEILSPVTTRLDKWHKLPILARSGTQEFWLVDPLLRQVQVYDLTANAERPAAYYEEMDTLQTPLLPGLLFPLREIFAQRF